jgi:hypothetical protein
LRQRFKSGLEDNAQRHPGPLTGFDHRVAFRCSARHRFLAQDMLPGLRGCQRQRQVQIVWRTNRHYVHVGSPEQLRIIGIPAATPFLDKGLAAFATASRHGHQFSFRNASNRCNMNGCNVACPNNAKV